MDSKVKKTFLKSILVFLAGFLVCNSVSAEPKTEKATFAGGCFWCMEKPFEEVDGVLAVISGYTGGPEVNPSYQQAIEDKNKGRKIEIDIKAVKAKVMTDRNA